MVSVSGDISQLALNDVRDRVYDKYLVTRSDAELAIDYLRCFFDAKRTHPDLLIILPQVADWAWHELILDTARYREMCSQLFGQFLHHIAKPIRAEKPRIPSDQKLSSCDTALTFEGVKRQSDKLREAFRRSHDMMRKTYSLASGDNPDEWCEAGWDRPAYRLRRAIELPQPIGERGHTPDEPVSLEEQHRPIRFLSWLPQRIAHRFCLPMNVATKAVQEYAESLHSLSSSSRHTGNGVLEVRSSLSAIAWQEHILWTRRYANDCHRLFGDFLDHSPTGTFAATVAAPT